MDTMVTDIHYITLLFHLFLDFAVSAPFEGNGFVYIYYGQEMDETGSIVNTTYQQVTLFIIVSFYLLLY